MADRISLPVKTINSERWAEMNVHGKDHVFCAEAVRITDQNYSFAGGHRVRLVSLKKNVHWKIPANIQLDISAIAPSTTPPRRLPNR
jgi:hypothetical protein